MAYESYQQASSLSFLCLGQKKDKNCWRTWPSRRLLALQVGCLFQTHWAIHFFQISQAVSCGFRYIVTRRDCSRSGSLAELALSFCLITEASWIEGGFSLPLLTESAFVTFRCGPFDKNQLINPFTAMLAAPSLGKRPIKVPKLKPLKLFCPFRVST